MRRRAILSLLGCAPLPSLACTVSPAHASYTKAQLVANTGTIVLAQSNGAKALPDATEFSFRTVEVLKGKNPGDFRVKLTSAPSSYVEIDFSAHTESEFWSGTHGRLPWLPGACAPAYAFEPGGQYLLFLESLANGAAAERVRSRSNRWYRYVRARAQGAL